MRKNLKGVGMAFKNLKQINDEIGELVEMNNKINAMKVEVNAIENFQEYNEAVINLNKLIDEYNERREDLKGRLSR